MLSNMAASLFENEIIRTTGPRAKALRSLAESLVTFAKKGDLSARRQVLRRIPNKKIVSKLFDELAQRYQSRSGGYTRIVKLGPRRGDAAELCIVELVDRTPSTATQAGTPDDTAKEEE
jgi:large subunit ribosomal protein L17